MTVVAFYIAISLLILSVANALLITPGTCVTYNSLDRNTEYDLYFSIDDGYTAKLIVVGFYNSNAKSGTYNEFSTHLIPIENNHEMYVKICNVYSLTNIQAHGTLSKSADKINLNDDGLWLSLLQFLKDYAYEILIFGILLLIIWIIICCLCCCADALNYTIDSCCQTKKKMPVHMELQEV